MSGSEQRRLAVVGQGYVGLPLTMRAVEVGLHVVGFDTDAAKVERLCRADSYIDDITDSDLGRALDTGRYRPTSDPAELAGFDIAVVTVPTPLREGAPDLTHVTEAARLLADHVRPGCLVVLESTTYPGTTEELFIPILESAGPLRAGRDFHVGYSPERIDPGNDTWTFRTTPKIVSGTDAAACEATRDFYALLVDSVVPVSGTREAELAKLLENTFRHVNIALINELAVFCHELGVNVWEVVDAAASKPFGFLRFTPGPGVGGHCLPIDPSYLSWQVRRSLGHNFRFVEIANDVNDHMPDYVVSRVSANLNRRRMPVNGSDVLLLGLSYKRDSGDARHSPAVAVAERLKAQGAVVRAADPLVEAAHVPAGITLVDCTEDELAAADVIVVLTEHTAFDWDLVARHADRVLDTRNRVQASGVDRL